MSRAPGMSLHLRQRAQMLPAVAETLSLLRMALPDLTDFLAREAEENPLVAYRPPRLPAIGLGGIAQESLAEADTRLAGLEHQLAAMRLAPPVRAMAGYLAGDLTEDGYLADPPAEIAARLDLPLALVEEGLAALQACEPTGIGARDLAECLYLQLRERGVGAATARAVTGDLAAAARGDWAGIARRAGLAAAGVVAAGALLPALSPRPAAAATAPPPVLLPEVVVARGPDGALRVTLAAAMAPELRVAALPADTGPTGEARAWLAGRRARALWLADALAYRQRTLLQVARALVARQSAFFLHGPDHMRPLTRSDLAEELGLHLSTVGRALAGKAVESPQGTHPLSVFFSPALPVAGGGDMSGFVIRRHIRRLIAAESPQAPLSDAAICTALRGMGVDIARRTVAKYRECMSIPPSFRRRGGQRRK